MNRVLFFHLPKAAGTAIKIDYEGTFKLFGHSSAAEIKKGLPRRDWDAAFKLGFVRNPWDRWVSAYHYFTNTKQWKGGSFEHWMKDGAKIQFEDPLPNAEQMFTYGEGQILVDFIGRVEALDEDMQRAASLGSFSFRGSIPVHNKSIRGLSGYQAYYTTSTREYVEERSQFEIDLMGYSFEETE